MPARCKKSAAEQARLAERDAAICALLEERPYGTTELAAMFSLPSGMHNVLKGLAKTGSIRRTADDRWALAEARVEPRDGAEQHIVAPTQQTVAHDEPPAAIEDDDPLIVDEDVEDTWAPPLRTPVPRRVVTRQAHERPASMTLAKDRAPSWWVTSPATGFTDAARAQQARMRGSRENNFVPFRTLQ